MTIARGTDYRPGWPSTLFQVVITAGARPGRPRAAVIMLWTDSDTGHCQRRAGQWCLSGRRRPGLKRISNCRCHKPRQSDLRSLIMMAYRASSDGCGLFRRNVSDGAACARTRGWPRPSVFSAHTALLASRRKEPSIACVQQRTNHTQRWPELQYEPKCSDWDHASGRPLCNLKIYTASTQSTEVTQLLY